MATNDDNGGAKLKQKFNSCSFCGTLRENVENATLIVGKNESTICYDCTVQSLKLFNEKSGEDRLANDNNGNKRLVPSEIKRRLDEHVIGQDSAKKTLAVAVYDHIKRVCDISETFMPEVSLGKSNILLLGPTGVGKTLLAKTLAKTMGVPFAIADATALTEAGYIGDDVESVVSKLLYAADMDAEVAETGIIYIDEIDKLARRGNDGSRDVGGEGVQQALLKIVEGMIVNVPVEGNSKKPTSKTKTVDTSKILFICGGAFAGLDEIVRRRQGKSITDGKKAGFLAENGGQDGRSVGDVFKEVRPEDFHAFGMIPEFIGRFPVVAPLKNLEENDLVRILTEPKDALVKQFEKQFLMDGVDLEIKKEALEAVAKKALANGTGARGLRSILEGVMEDTKFNMPGKRHVKKIVVGADVVNEGKEPLYLSGDAEMETMTPLTRKENGKKGGGYSLG